MLILAVLAFVCAARFDGLITGQIAAILALIVAIVAIVIFLVEHRGRL